MTLSKRFIKTMQMIIQEKDGNVNRARVLDEFCTEIERDPATLVRSVQIIIDPRENAASTRQTVQGFIAAGVTHLVLAPRALNEGIAHWLSEEIIKPVREAAGDSVPVGEPQER